MIIRELDIPSYEWKVLIYYAVTSYFTSAIMKSLEEIECPVSLLNRVHDNMQKNEMNSGFTYSNKKMKRTVVVVGLFTSPAQFMNSFSHELRHLVDDITDKWRLPKAGEEVAYLTGDIYQHLANDISLFLCHCDRCKTKIKDKCYDADITCNHPGRVDRKSYRDDV